MPPAQDQGGKTRSPMLKDWLRPTLYASGNFGKNILWNTTEVLLLFLLTDLLGIDPAVAGAVILMSLVLDALIDPLVGMLLEKVRTPLGQFGPVMLVGAPLAAFSFVGLMSLSWLGRNELWIVIPTLLLFRVGYTLIDVPHNSLLSRAAFDSRRRSGIAALRFGFSSLASLVLAIVIAPLVSQDDPLSPTGLVIFACVAGLASACVMVLSWFAVRRADIEMTRSMSAAVALRDVLRSLWRNTNYLYVLALSGVAALTLPLFAKSQLYVTRYVMEAPDVASGGLLAMILGQFIGLPLWTWIAHSRENTLSMTGAHLWLLISAAAFGLFGTLSIPLYLGLCTAIGIAASGIYSIIWAMIADCVEDGQSQTGYRAEATLFAFATLVQKSAIGIGAALFGLALSGAGYQAGETASQQVQWTMIAMATGLPFLGAGGCLILLRQFRLSHADHHAAVQQISTREANAPRDRADQPG